MIRDRVQTRNKGLLKKTIIILILALAMCLFFLLYDAMDAWKILAKMRSTRLIGLIVVSASLSVATACFQAITRNRILSPSVMGFESIYSLIATLLVFVLTSAVTNRIPRTIMFLIQTGFMSLISVGLFTNIIDGKKNSINFMVLLGIVFGIFLRSIRSMLVSIMDPNEFMNVQDLNTASFAIIDESSLLITTIVAISVMIYLLTKRDIIDVIYLGRDHALNLGVNYSNEIKKILVASSILVACATALVGPLMLFGLLIANMSAFYLGSTRMSYYIPTTAFMGILVLVGGQAVLEHVVNQATILPVVLEFVGGILLLILIGRGAKL